MSGLGTTEVLIVFVLIVVPSGISGLVGWAIGKGKGRGKAGFWLGAALGLIGWIIVGTMDPTPEELARRQYAWAQQYGPYAGYGSGVPYPAFPTAAGGTPPGLVAPHAVTDPPYGPGYPNATPFGGPMPQQGPVGPGPLHGQAVSHPTIGPTGPAGAPLPGAPLPGLSPAPLVSHPTKMTVGEGIILGSAALLLISSLLPWYRVAFGGFVESRTGWEAPARSLTITATLLGIGLAVAVLTSVGIRPSTPSTPEWDLKVILYPAVGALSFALVLVRLLTNTSHVAVGAWIGLLATGGLMVGGVTAAVSLARGRSPAAGLAMEATGSPVVLKGQD